MKKINSIHEFMSYHDMFISNSISLVENVAKIPYDSVILLFGGYRSPAFDLAKMLFQYFEEYQEWPAILITGKCSNKIDNTAGLGSEVNVYQLILEHLGIPCEVVRKYYVEPKDSSTKENMQSVNEMYVKWPELMNKTLVLATQSYYRRRAVHDFAVQLCDVKLAVLDLPMADFENGMFYNDRANGTALDVFIGACFYQAMYNKPRWDKGEAIAPTLEEQEFKISLGDIKSLLQEYCGWIYPNNLVDTGIVATLEEGKLMIAERRAVLMSRPGLSVNEQIKELNNALGI